MRISALPEDLNSQEVKCQKRVISSQFRNKNCCLPVFKERIKGLAQGHNTVTRLSQEQITLRFPVKSLPTEYRTSVAQSVTCLATDASLTADPRVESSIPARSHTFVEIDHEIISPFR